MLLVILFIAIQTAAGALWWRWARGTSTTLLEALGMGLALGTAAASLGGTLLFPILPSTLAWAAPAILTVVLWAAVPRLRRTRGLRATQWGPSLWAIGVGGLGGLITIAVNLRNYPLDRADSIGTYHPDMLFFEALSRSLAVLGPSDSIFLSGGEVRYHWLTYAWSGQLAASAATEPFVMLTRVMPLVSLAGTILVAITWTMRATRAFWAPTVAAVLVVLGGYVGATYGTVLNFDSPSQSLSTVWMLGLCVALLSCTTRRWTSHAALLGRLGVVAMLGAATAGGKISSAAIVVAGWLIASVVATVRRELFATRAWVAFITMTLGAAFFYFLFIAGSAEQGGLGLGQLLNKASSVQGLNPTDYWWGIIAGTLILAVAVIPRWAGMAWLLASSRSRWSPMSMLSLGMAGAGIATLLLFSGGLNDTWFALAASAPLSVASAVGVSRALSHTYPGRTFRPAVQVVAVMLAASCLSVVVALLWTAGPGGTLTLRWLAPLVGVAGAVILSSVIAPTGGRGSLPARMLALTIVALLTLAALGRMLSLGASSFAVQPEAGMRPTEFRPVLPFTDAVDRTTVTSWTRSQVDAGQWLKNRATPGELTATNITFSPLVPALSGQPTYATAIQYQAPYGRPAQLDELLARERASISFIDTPRMTVAKELCADGVRWVWVDPARTSTSSWEPFAKTMVTSADVAILRINPSACG